MERVNDMLYFVLFMRNDQLVYVSLWSEGWCGDDLEPLAVEVRKRCAEQNGKYVALWGFDLKSPIDEVCSKLHEKHGEDFLKLAAEAFGKGYRKGKEKTKMSLADWRFSPELFEFCEKYPEAMQVLNVARARGLSFGVRDYPE